MQPVTHSTIPGRRAFSDFRWPSWPWTLFSALWRTLHVYRTATSASSNEPVGDIPAPSRTSASQRASESFIWQPLIQRWYLAGNGASGPGEITRFARGLPGKIIRAVAADGKQRRQGQA